MSAPQAPGQGWLEPAPHAASPLEGVLGWSPELLKLFKNYYGSFWDSPLFPADHLEMVRLRIAQIHGCDAELATRHEASGLSDAKREALAKWRTSTLFDDEERAMLDYAEMIPFQHHFIEDAQAEAVKEHLDDGRFVAFTVALSLFDAICRLKMAFALPAVEPKAVDAPASSGGVLY